MSPIRPNAIWAMNFQFDTAADGRTIELLTSSTNSPVKPWRFEVDRSIDADGIVDVLAPAPLTHRARHYMHFDNGPEFRLSTSICTRGD